MDPIEQLLEKARERYEKTGKYTDFLTGRPCNPENGYDNDDRHHICCLKNDSESLEKFGRLIKEIKEIKEINRRGKDSRVQRMTEEQIRVEEGQVEKWKDFPQIREEFDDLHMKMNELHDKMDELLALARHQRSRNLSKPTSFAQPYY